MTTELDRPADLIEAIRSGQIPDLGDPKAVALRVVEEILNAETIEAAFDTGGSTPTRDLVGQRLVINDVRLMPGQIEDASLPAYVLLDCEDEGGAKLLVNSGAARIVGQAVWLKMKDMLPQAVAVVEIAAARPGQSAPLGLSIV
jgi:hypothetical protein